MGPEPGAVGNREFGRGRHGPWAETGLRISADEKVAWMVGVPRDGSVPTSRPAGSASDPISLQEETLHPEALGAVPGS
ncbi:MAG: hypothetical protein EA421_04965 [Gemmatimonadales bacterium]|nr:MAG: hypothetical protein EA421_04965 [Gemmatimonadales bacterium]